MKNIGGWLESNGVDRPVGIPTVVLHDLKDAWSLASPRFGAGVLAPELRHAQSRTDLVLNRVGEGPQVLLAGPHPKQRLLARDSLRSRHVIIPILGYSVKRAMMVKTDTVIRRVSHRAQYLPLQMLEKHVRTAGALAVTKLCQNPICSGHLG